MNLVPIGKKLIVEIISKEKTEGGIVLAKDVESYHEGKVLAIGDIKDVKVGDNIIFSKHIGIEIEGLVVIDEESIILKRR